MALYDRFGTNYSSKRATDPHIASALHAELSGADSLLNIGAGTGSYEPEGFSVVALEPSAEMISQRAAGACPVVRGCAEQLPFPDKHFSHVMTVLSIHHWQDRACAFAEIKRVARQGFVALTWDPACVPFWLTRDYFPEFFERDVHNFPAIEEFRAHFHDVQMLPVPIPHDCRDGFLAAYWRRPEAYLDPDVRHSISSFAKLHASEPRLERLKEDIESGAWAKRNADILNQTSIDAGYRLVVART